MVEKFLIAERYELLEWVLDERQRRMFVAAEAKVLDEAAFQRRRKRRAYHGKRSERVLLNWRRGDGAKAV